MTSKPLDEVFRDSRSVSRFWAEGDPVEILSAELGSRFDDYRRLWDLARSFQSVPPFPLHVDYELKRECGLRCPMCPMGLKAARAGASGGAGGTAASAGGAEGAAGPAGSVGRNGRKGPKGRDGLIGLEGPERPPGAARADGSEGAEGAGGARGADGAVGSERADMAEGADGAESSEASRPGAGPGGPELEAELVEDLIDQGVAGGQASMGFGGMWEPLTSPHVPRLVAHGRSRGLVEAMFNTNGLRLAPDVARDLIGAGLTRIMISLDAATEATYDRIRPGSDFRLVKSNILELLAARARAKRRLPLVRLSFCLTSLNEGELDAFLDQWRGRVDFFSIQRFGNYSERPSRLFPRLGLVPPPHGRCAQPFKRLMVRHDGLVLPCCDLSGLDLALGDVRRTPLAAIWEGAAIRSLRETLLAGGDRLGADCRRCQDKFQP